MKKTGILWIVLLAATMAKAQNPIIQTIHDLFLVFKGSRSDLFRLDWWKFNAQ